MHYKRTVGIAFKGLTRNKSRAVLTILGIVIGITAIIVVMAMGKSAQSLILSQVQGMGSKTIVVIPGREPEGPNDLANVFLDSLKERDLEAIKKPINVPNAEDVMPIVFGTARMNFGQETYQSTILGTGSTDVENIVGKIFDIYPSTGRFFSIDEIKSQASVAVIGDKVRAELFGENVNPVGEKFKIKDRNFRVIGVLAAKGQVSFFNFDDMVLVPYTTAGQYIFGRKYFDRIIVSAKTEAGIEQTVEDLKRTMRENHNIDNPDKDDFFVQTQADLANRLSTITTAFTLFLVAVAGIALLVGGIGIMNIMLVSVTERTKEIGLRKALGATNRDILRQFLYESVLLTLVGGVVGIIFGVLISATIAILVTQFSALVWSFQFPWGASVLGLLVSGGIGLIFGVYPARQASKKNPIEALRYE